MSLITLLLSHHRTQPELENEHKPFCQSARGNLMMAMFECLRSEIFWIFWEANSPASVYLGLICDRCTWSDRQWWALLIVNSSLDTTHRRCENPDTCSGDLSSSLSYSQNLPITQAGWFRHRSVKLPMFSFIQWVTYGKLAPTQRRNGHKRLCRSRQWEKEKPLFKKLHILWAHN